MNTLLAILIKKGEVKVLPDNTQYRNRFEIKSETSNRLYVIAQHRQNLTWGCSCFGWIRYKRCKHLTTLKPLLTSLESDEQKNQLGPH